MTDRAIIGQRIAELRKAQGLTQAELADRLGVSHQAVSQWERAETLPDIMTLPKIAEIFGAGINTLLGMEDIPASALIPEEEVSEEAPAVPAEVEVDVAVDAEAEVDVAIDVAAEVEDFGDSDEDAALEAEAFGNVAGKYEEDEPGNLYYDDESSCGVSKNHFSIPTTDYTYDFSGEDGSYEIAIIRDGKIVTSFIGNPDNFVRVYLSNPGGNVNSELSLTVKGDVNGSAQSGISMKVNGNVHGTVHSGTTLEIGGDVGGNANSGTSMICGNVGGSASAGVNLNCMDVGGSITAGSKASWASQSTRTQESTDIETLGREYGKQEILSILDQIFPKSESVKFDEEAPDFRIDGMNVTIEGDYNGDLTTAASVTVQGDVSGSVSSQGTVNVGGDVDGDANAGSSLSIGGDVDGNSTACGNITVGGDVNGDTHAGDKISVGGDVSGDVDCGGDVQVNGDICGDLDAGGSVTVEGDCSGDIDAAGNVTIEGECGGDIDAQGNVTVEGECGGDIDAGGDITIHGNYDGDIDTSGNVHIEGDVNGSIEGNNVTVHGSLNP